MAFEPTLAGFDRDAAGADAAWTRWCGRLKTEPGSAKNEEPLGQWRHVAGRNAYDEVGRLAPTLADAPWREALRRWTFELTLRRTSQDLRVSWALAAAEPAARLHIDRPRPISYAEAWDELLGETEPERIAAFLDAAAQRGPTLAAFAREMAQRRVEVAARLELAHPFALATSMTNEALRSAALSVLKVTADLASSLGREARRSGSPNAVPGLLGAKVLDAPEGWPSRLTKRWLEEMFGDLARGLALKVAVPRALGAASFARALGGFGYALRVAGVSRSLPFALAVDPYFVDAHRYALVFAALPASPAFQRRTLHNVARIAQAQARRLAAAALFETRSIAVRALLSDEMQSPRVDAFEELSASLFGGPLPAGLVGAWPRARGDEWVRLLALLTAAPLAEELVDRFDDDWFINPRVVTYLRARASAPARDALDLEPPPATAAAHLGARFEQALG